MFASLRHASSRQPGITARCKRPQRTCFAADARQVMGYALLEEANAPELVQVGVIGGTHGVHGEVRVQPTTDFPEERLQKPGRRWIQPSKKGLGAATTRAGPRQVESMGGRPHIYKGHSLWILKFKNIDQREEAALLNGSQLMISSDEREELPQDEYYIQQLIGLDVIQQNEGDVMLGRVDSVFPGDGSPDILIIHRHPDNKAKPILLPFVKEFVPVVDLQRGRMLVTPPEGLLELSEAKYLPQSDEEQNIDDD